MRLILWADEDKVELAVINPAYVMGPVLHGSQCTSMEVSYPTIHLAVASTPPPHDKVRGEGDVLESQHPCVFVHVSVYTEFVWTVFPELLSLL